MGFLKLGMAKFIFVGPGKAVLLLWILLLSFWGSGSLGSFEASNLDEGLVGWWKFDEGTGATALDSSGHGNVGAINEATYVPGINSTGLQFDGGTYDFVEIPHSTTLNITGPMTIELWILPTQDTTQTGIISKQSKDSLGGWPSNYKFLLQQKGDPSGPETKKFFLWLSDGSCLSIPTCASLAAPAGEFPVFGGTVQLNSWQHVVVVYDGVNAMIYSNGEVVADSKVSNGGGQITFASQLNSETNPILIGRDRNAYFQGIIDEVRVYDRALSASEVLERCNLTEPEKAICS